MQSMYISELDLGISTQSNSVEKIYFQEIILKTAFG